MKKIAIIIVGVVLVLGIGIFAGMKFLGPKGDEAVAAKAAPVEQASEGGASAMEVYPLETFIVNLDGEGGRRYLKVKMTLEVDGKRIDSLNKQLYKVRDSILILLSSKTFEDVKGAEGKYALREEVKGRINRIAGKKMVKDVYLVEFVVQ